MISKINKKAAMRPQTPSTGGWGEEERSLVGEYAFPYLEMPTSIDTTFLDNAEINGRANKNKPRLSGRKVDLPLSFHGKYNKFNYPYYWMFGFENTTKYFQIFRGAWTGVPLLGMSFNGSTRNQCVATSTGTTIEEDDTIDWVFGATTITTTVLAGETLAEFMTRSISVVMANPALVNDLSVLTYVGSTLTAKFKVGSVKVLTSVTVTTAGTGDFEFGSVTTTTPAITLTFKYLLPQNSSSTQQWYLLECESKLGYLPAGVVSIADTSTGLIVLTIAEYTGVKAGHQYELDCNGRFTREFTTAEQAVIGYDGRKKSLNATIGVKMDSYDLAYESATCRSFAISSSAGDMMKVESNFLAYDQNIKTPQVSDGWTYPTGILDSLLIPMHHELSFTLYESDNLEHSYPLCLTDFKTEVDCPLQQIQTNCSGLQIAEPVPEDKYSVMVTGTIARHSGSIFQTLRNNEEDLCGLASYNKNNNYIMFLYKNLSLKKAGGDDAGVVAEPLELEACHADVNPLFQYLFTSDIQQGSTICLVINDDLTNSMFHD